NRSRTWFSPSTMAITIADRLASDFRAAATMVEADFSSAQSTSTASKLRSSTVAGADAGSLQCSTWMLRSSRARVNTCTALASAQTNRDVSAILAEILGFFGKRRQLTSVTSGKWAMRAGKLLPSSGVALEERDILAR